MKQYQLYVRLFAADPWSYCDTYTTPALAWTAQMLAMARGCSCRMVTSAQVKLDQDVLRA